MRVFLEDMEFRPHKVVGWVNSPDKDAPEFKERVKQLCELYRSAKELAEVGTRVISVDEKTGMQALAPLAPELPTRCGDDAKREFEYTRNGTATLIAGIDVASGKLVAPTLGLTRTEEDFAAHIAATIDTAPDAKWVFVADQLNTHMSETLVGLVAERCGDTQDLGIKGKSGILHSKATRKQYLEEPEHRIRFMYTPRHASWMNQIEIWFGILSRKALRRGVFRTVAELIQKVRDFIEYYNATMAKPFKWTYGAAPCTV